MLSNQLDLFGKAERPGFRLDRLEVYNWGTFHNKVWTLSTAGGQNLLTGDVGSGKSSLVDALTTLLVPHHRITYNKAAGAEKQERSLYTYIRGAYGNEQDEESQSSKLLTLRDETSYSVILGVFNNESLQRSITLAQVFRIKKNDKNPDRFYVLSEDALSIQEHFFKVKKDISDIRAFLRKREGCETFDSFKEYSLRFRQEFGIKSEQALDLFYQAVSMKSVGNLTDFVRQHMLEKTNVDSQIEELCASFEDLRSAHEAILRARHQIELLQPISDIGDKFEQDQIHREDFFERRTHIDPFIASLKMDLLKDSIKKLEDKKEKAYLRKEKLQAEQEEERKNSFELEISLQNQGGGRIQALEFEIEQKNKEKNRRLHQEQRYQAHIHVLSYNLPRTMDEFLQQRNQTQTLKAELQERKETLESNFVNLKIEISNLQSEEKGLQREIDSLRNRQSNIPSMNLRLREEMAIALGLSADDLPFVGELLQVKASEKKWEGALERVLRNFGLSLLVSDQHYPAVARYVNSTHLKGKLVYFRVQTEKRGTNKYSSNSLPAKMDIRRDSDFFEWLRNELENHFNFECCEDIEEFQRYPKALSLTGQMKVSGKKHEKDDRHQLNDKSRFVLGWSNKEKLQSLRDHLADIQSKGQKIADQIASTDSLRKSLEVRLQSCEGLLYFSSFDDIHWQELAESILSLENEIQTLRKKSDILDTLKGLIVESKNKIRANDERIAVLQKEQGQLENEIKSQEEAFLQAQETANAGETDRTILIFSKIRDTSDELGIFTDLSLININKKQSLLRESIQAKIDSLTKGLESKREKLVKLIGEFLHHYKEFSVNVDASIGSLPELRMTLGKLKDEDLPRHEARFYKKLKEDTINGMAMFQELLEKERRGIENKIQVINDCLRDIDYNPGTYICILLNKTVDQEISHFRHDLRLILSNTTGPESIYTEQKFLQVKNIIDRLKGRPQNIDADRKWTSKVTDVRNWFTFAASERFKEDNSEKEFYPDSGGKSGGQKEKLAYTVLASALAYQYGIEALNNTPKSFRFVMIDEAFGRGSDESARYGLTLFEKLNLQLLVVTPLQKIHIIEDYVSHVHFVHNEASKNSRLHSLTIEQFKEEKIQQAEQELKSKEVLFETQ